MKLGGETRIAWELDCFDYFSAAAVGLDVVGDNSGAWLPR